MDKICLTSCSEICEFMNVSQFSILLLFPLDSRNFYFIIVTNGKTNERKDYNGYQVPVNKWIRISIVRRYGRDGKQDQDKPSIGIFLMDHIGKQHFVFSQDLNNAKPFIGVPLYSGTQQGKIRNLHINGKVNNNQYFSYFFHNQS